MNLQQQVISWYKQGLAFSVNEGELSIEDHNNILTPDILKQIKGHKQEIISLISNLNNDTYVMPKVQKKQYRPGDKINTSLAQKSILFLESLAGGQSYYNIPVAYKITGELNKAALHFALRYLIDKHDVFRTVYHLEQGEYTQQVQSFGDLTPANFVMNEVHISELENKDIERVLAQEASYPFDLTNQWPIRGLLITLTEQSYILSLNIHHIATDGFSARQIIRDLNTGYQLFNQEQVKSDSASDVFQYADYCAWQTQWQESKHFQQSKEYWLATLKDIPHLHSFPTDFVRPNIQGTAGGTYNQVLDTSLNEQIRIRAKVAGVTPFVLLQACFSAFLMRYSDSFEVVFGTAAANRSPEVFMDTVGLFANTLVLRYQASPQCSFDELLQMAKQVNNQALKHQHFPFDVLVEEIKAERSAAYNPLVQIMFVMQEATENSLAFKNTQVTPLVNKQQVAKFDLTLHVKMADTGIELDWEYNLGLFKPNSIKVIADHFKHLIDTCLHRPEQKIAALVLDNQLMTTAQASTFSPPGCIHRLFEARARELPEAIALVDGELVLSYQELNWKAEQLASHLFQECQGKVGNIGVYMEKSADMVISMLAILKSGGVYVPLDPHYPTQRLEFMCLDAKITKVLTNHSTAFPEGFNPGAALLYVDTCLSQTPKKNHITDFAFTDETSAAYIIYTSGSTGNPKGVQVSHKSLYYSLQANKNTFDLHREDSMPTIGSQAFGVSMLEIFLPLIAGAKVKLVKKSDISDISRLIDITNDVSVLHAVPSLMTEMLELITQKEQVALYPELRLLLVGAEPVPEILLRKIKLWRPDIRLRVLYGMTESSVVSSSYEATDDSPSCYCIGQPHPNTEFYVLSAQGMPQPVGVPGELFVGGLSLADGYVNHTQLTLDKFYHHQAFDNKRLYQTGDRVRVLPDGNYEFLGRVDHQVSLRGVRIETGEIENLVNDIAGVKKSIAHVKQFDNGEQIFILYFTRDKQGMDPVDLSADISACLKQKLPTHMRPSIIEHLTVFPLNPNGKVDRKALPLPESSGEIEAPTTEIEHYLVTLWCAALQREQVSVMDSFFEIGGHSLMVTKLVNQINNKYDIQLPLVTFFEATNIRGCALVIEQAVQLKLAQELIQQSEGSSQITDDEILI